MTNYEYYKDEIRRIAGNSFFGIAVEEKTYNLYPCADFPCDRCLFFSNEEKMSCNFLMLDWASQTYKETLYKELFSDIPDAESHFLAIVYSGYIARDFDGTLHFYESKHPRWIENYWFDENNNIIINKEYFNFIKPGECYLFDKNMKSNEIKIINITEELRR